MSGEPEIREQIRKISQQLDNISLSSVQGQVETSDKESIDTALKASSYGSQNNMNLLLNTDSCNTEKKKEQSTDLSEKYRTLYNNLRDGSAAVDLQGRIIECNSAFERMVGYSFDELKTITFEDITPEQWHAFERRILEEQVIKRGYSDLYEKEYQHKNGKIFPVELQTYAILDNEKKLSGFWAVVRDISERKKVEEGLQQSEERFRIAISTITDILYEWNIKSDTVQWFGDIDSLLGYENGAFPRTLDGFLKHLHPDDATTVHTVIKKGLTEHQKWEGEYRLITKNGEERYWYGTGIGVYNDEGEPLKVIGAITDITARKQAEIALEESRQMLRLIMDTIPVRVFWKDRESKYLGCNKPFASDAGLHSPDDVIGKNDYDMGWVEQAEFYRADDQRVIQSGQPKLNYIEPQTTPDGRRIWVRTSKIPLMDTKNNIIGVLGTYEDITQQKEVEDALRRSEEQYRLVTENASDVIWTMDLNLKFTYFSPSNEKLTGYHINDALNLSLDELLTPESVECVLQTFAAEMELDASGKRDPFRSIILELQEIKADGTIFPIESRMCFLRDADNNPIGILGINRDISERKKAEEALKKSEEKFVKAFKLSPVAIAINRLSDGKFLNVNEAFTRLCGYDAPELLLHTPAELNLWVNADDMKKIVDELITSGSLHNQEYIFRTKAGNLVVTRYSAGIIDFSGERCYLSVLIDITQQKNMEESLRESEEKYRSIVENTQDVIMLTNPDGRVEYLSPTCYAVLGHPPDELIGTIPEILYPDDLDKFHSALSKALQGQPRTNLEYRIRTKNGSVRWVSHSWASISTHDNKLKYIVSVVRNITETKLAEQNLKIKIQELERYKNVTVNRELKMIELKKENNGLKDIIKSLEHSEYRNEKG